MHFVIYLNIWMKFKEIYVCLICKIRDQIEIINTLIFYETLAFSSNIQTFSLFTRSLKRKSKLALRHKKHNNRLKSMSLWNTAFRIVINTLWRKNRVWNLKFYCLFTIKLSIEGPLPLYFVLYRNKVMLNKKLVILHKSLNSDIPTPTAQVGFSRPTCTEFFHFFSVQDFPFSVPKTKLHSYIQLWINEINTISAYLLASHLHVFM